MALGLKMTRVETASPKAIAAAGACLRAGGLVAMPTETVYGLAADATSDAAVAVDLRSQGAAGDQPAHRPCPGHRDGARAWPFRLRRRDARPRVLARAPHPGRARRSDLEDQPAGARRPRQCGGSLAVARNRAGADRGGGRPPCGALSEPIGPGEPDHRRSCRRRSRWQGRLHPRRRAMPPWSRVRRSSAVWAAGPNCCVRERSRGRRSNRRFERQSSRAGGARAAPNAPGQLASHYAPKAALRLGAAHVSADEAALDFGGALKGASPGARLDLSPSGDLVEAASHLFSYLRALDATGPERIAVAAIPEHGLGAAINDRLRRAAAPRGH